jgi:hypothetical protein
MESCFDQSPRMEYVVAGLQPGQSYMLRVVLFERSSALAVSVRAFRVGAVSLSSELSAVRRLESVGVNLHMCGGARPSLG